MADLQGSAPPVDFEHPNPARLYEFLLGGSEFYPPDVALAEKLMDPETGYPGMRELVRVNRRFVLEASRWCASMLGVGQFLDLGCGMPSAEMVHDAARRGSTEARVCYADHDPVVACHVRAAIDGGAGLAVIEADAADPEAVLKAARQTGIISTDEPLGVILGGTLSAMEPGVARAAVAGYAEVMAPRSAVVASCVSYSDAEFGAKMSAMFGEGGGGTWLNHSAGDAASFFAAGGLRLVRGRVADVRSWPMLDETDEAAAVLGGVGVRD